MTIIDCIDKKKKMTATMKVSICIFMTQISLFERSVWFLHDEIKVPMFQL